MLQRPAEQCFRLHDSWRETQTTWCRRGLLPDKRHGPGPRHKSPAPANHGGGSAAGQTDDLSTGTAELALQWLDLLDRRVKMFFKKLLQNVHERDSQRPAVTKITGDRLYVTVPKGQAIAVGP